MQILGLSSCRYLLSYRQQESMNQVQEGQEVSSYSGHEDIHFNEERRNDVDLQTGLLFNF